MWEGGCWRPSLPFLLTSSLICSFPRIGCLLDITDYTISTSWSTCNPIPSNTHHHSHPPPTASWQPPGPPTSPMESILLRQSSTHPAESKEVKPPHRHQFDQQDPPIITYYITYFISFHFVHAYLILLPRKEYPLRRWAH